MLSIKVKSNFSQPLKAVVINSGGLFSLQFQYGEQDDLQEGNQLTVDQPDINQPDVGCGGQLLHHTEGNRVQNRVNEKIRPKNTHLMKSVVETSITVRFTVTAASK